jgi:putative ABC transport system permease protein
MATWHPIARVEAVMRDGRLGLRHLRRDWPFTVAAILILGLGIGGNTAIFSVVNAVLFRATSLPEPDRLVDIYQNASNRGGVDGNSYPAYLDIAAYTDVFANTTAVLVPHGVSYQHEGALRPAVVEHTTATYLSVLGLRPALGRWFNAAEDTRGAAVVAVIGYQAWTRRFGADPSVLGRTIRIEGVPVTIVGVGPAGHNGTLNIGIVTDFWLPISSLATLGAPPRALERRPDEAAFLVKARLRDGITIAQAQAAMRILGTRLASEYPTEDPGKGISVIATSDVRVHPQIDAALRGIAFALLAVVGLVLALACSNLATLLLVRGAARAKEVSVRLALGATRAQLVRHLLIENLLLSAVGGAAGCVLAWWSVALLGTIDLPIVVDVRLDYRVLTFAVGLSLLTGLAFGLAPALETTTVDLVPTLRNDGETRSPHHHWFTLKDALVVFQLTVSVVLLGGTAIFLQMLSAARAQRVGFAVDGVAMLQMDARYAGYSGTTAQTVSNDIRRRVSMIPGVQSAVLTRGLPMDVTGMHIVIDDAAAGSSVSAGAIWAGPGYFEALRIPILYGRAIDERDRRDAPRVAVISEAMARQYFGTANAVGRRFRFEQDPNDWFEVVGIAPTTGTAGLAGDLVDPTPQLFFRSFAQADMPPDTVLARTSLDAAALVAGMQREVRAANSALPVVAAKTMADYLEESLMAPKAAATLLAILGALGLGLAGIGLYAVVAFRVSRRFREIGIRTALGARRLQVVGPVIEEVAVLLGIGTGVGLLLSMLTILALRAFSAPAAGISFYRPTPDPAAMAAIAVFMTVVGLAAALLPAWRAATMDPLKALRRD